jgi:HEAT repeat protein
MLSGLWLSAVCVWGVAAQDPQGDAGDPPGDSPDRWIRVLQQHLEGNTSEDKEACRHAAQALGEIGPAAAAAVPVLTQALTARSVEVRNFAVDALGRIGPAAAASVPAILKEVDLPKDHVNYVPLAFFRLLAARALGRIGPEARQAIPLLQATLQSDDVAYRVAAAVAMWKIARHEAALPTLTAIIRDDPPRGPYEAILALADFGDAAEPATELLVTTLGSKHPDHRRAAAEVLTQRDVDAMLPVAQRLRAKTYADPAAAIYYLGQRLAAQRKRLTYDAAITAEQFVAASRVAIREVVPALLPYLSDPREDVRQSTIRALAEMGLTAGPLLVPVLQSGDPAARDAAIEILQRVEDRLPEEESGAAVGLIKRALLPKLIAATGQTDPQVRTAAFRGLARFSFGSDLEQARPQLRGALRDDDAVVRRFAFEALDQLRASSE